NGLHPHVCRPDPPVRPPAVCRARHRRVRTQRLSRRPPEVLRGRPAPRRGRRAEGARRRWRGRALGGRERDRALRHRDGLDPAVDAVSDAAAQKRARFAELHAREGIFVMPNPWDVGSAKLLASVGAEVLATTSAGFAWTLGRLDGEVTRDELVAHVAEVAAATPLPLNVDSERCYPDDPGGVAETVRLLGEAGAAGCSIEDWNPADGRIEDLEL